MRYMEGASKPQIESIMVTPLFGRSSLFPSIPDAIAFVKSGEFDNDEFLSINIRVKYTFRNWIDAEFEDVEHVLEFLENRERGVL